jgi:cytochrome c-type biogenesis protein CcmF
LLAGIALAAADGRLDAAHRDEFLLAVWIVASGVFQIMERLKTGKPSAASFWGMHVAHFGIAVFVIGVAMVGGYQEEKDVRMEPGDTVQVGGYGFRLVGVKSAPGPNYRASVGTVELSGRPRAEDHVSGKAQYFSSQMPMTEAAIDAGFTRDVYVSLGEPLDKRRRLERAGLLQALRRLDLGRLPADGLGGVIAMLDRRYRLRVKSAARLPGGVPA